jgi:hypothetical protein
MTNPFEHIVLNRQPMPYDYRDYRMADFLNTARRRRAAATTSMRWEVKRILDQGAKPHCVGFAWAGFGISVPVFDDWTDVQGDAIYYEAKKLDGDPGGENGSTTRSGVQAFMKFGSLQNNAYAFANSIQDITDWLLSSGPVIVGTNWYDGMFYPDSNSVVSISGSVAGGHEYMLSGYDTLTRLVLCTNSWGTGYGKAGQFYMSLDTLARLMAEQGDACTAMEVTGTPVPPPDPSPSGCLTLSIKIGNVTRAATVQKVTHRFTK